jgi:hypothetical protein
MTWRAAASRLPALAEQAGMTDTVLRLARIEGVRRIIQAAIDDAYLSEEEEDSITKATKDLSLTDADLVEALGDQASAFMIARINAGRLPTLPNPAIFLKPKETAYAQVPATLLKEVVQREMRGGYSGFSVPIVKGVRYRVGAYRGHSVVTGTSLQAADSGVLCLTSQRVVFQGQRQTVECLLAKLVGMNVFDTASTCMCQTERTRRW